MYLSVAPELLGGFCSLFGIKDFFPLSQWSVSVNIPTPKIGFHQLPPSIREPAGIEIVGTCRTHGSYKKLAKNFGLNI
jgi:hypothetical protein